MLTLKVPLEYLKGYGLTFVRGEPGLIVSSDFDMSDLMGPLSAEACSQTVFPYDRSASICSRFLLTGARLSPEACGGERREAAARRVRQPVFSRVLAAGGSN